MTKSLPRVGSVNEPTHATVGRVSSVTEPEMVAPAGLEHRRARASLAVVSAGTLITLMNYCAPMTTLPQTVAGLSSGLTGETWILNGIVLGLAALLLTVGSLADDHGRK